MSNRKLGESSHKEKDSDAVVTLPVGSVVAYPVKLKIPAGYFLCDGSEKDRKKYRELFAVIGTIYGEGDGMTTFSIPDVTDGTTDFLIRWEK